MAPRRTAGSGLEAASKLTVPSPWPLAPALIVSQGFCTSAVHAHSRAVLTVISPVPPPAGSGEPGGVTATPHFDTVPGEVTVVVPDEPQAAATRAAAAAHTKTRLRRCRCHELPLRWAIIRADCFQECGQIGAF